MKEPFSRDEAGLFQSELKDILFTLFEGAEMALDLQACGGYRRGERDLSELDFLITRSDGGSCIHLLTQLIERMEEKGLLVMQLKEIRLTPASGSCGFQGIARLPGGKSHRIDIHVYPENFLPYALLYFTGPAVFNRFIREQALNMGLSFSDSGLDSLGEKDGLFAGKLTED
jgi:DNA polymerase/3'-5' exonuclease PolX